MLATATTMTIDLLEAVLFALLCSDGAKESTGYLQAKSE